MPFIETPKGNVLFVHVPKCGGSSVERWMQSHGHLHLHTPNRKPPALRSTAQHLRVWDIRQLLHPSFFAYAFAIVRNPFRRLESEYRMRWIAHSGKGQGDLASFPIWLSTELDAYQRDPFHADNHFRPASNFIGNRVEIFRFEDGIDSILARVAEATDLPAPGPAPHEMGSAGFAGEIAWDSVDVHRVQDLYRRDFDEFGYPDTPDA